MRVCRPLKVLLVVVLAACGPNEPSESQRVVDVLQFLIDSNGMDHFDRAQLYCVGNDESGTDAPGEVLGQLYGRGGQVVAASRCRFDEELGGVVGEDGMPAVAIWARVATKSERSEFTPEASPNAEWVSGAVLVRAGFERTENSGARYLCWQRSDPQPKVVQCDVLSVS